MIYPLGKGCVTLSQTNPCFYVSTVQVFWKHCGKRRNCSERAISPFSHSVFYRFGELSAIFINFYFVFCKLFQFGPAQIIVVWYRVDWSRWSTLPSNTLSNYGSINGSIKLTCLTEDWPHAIEQSSDTISKRAKKKVSSKCTGWHESIQFPTALSPLFKEHGKYIQPL